MSSIDSLLGLPLLFSPSMILNTTFFINWLSFIIGMCPNNFSFLSMIICITFLLMSSLNLSLHSLFSVVLYVENSSVTFHFKCHQVSHAYRSTLITHDLIMLSFVRMLMRMLFHTFLNPAIATVAHAILLLISLLQSISHVRRLPRYTNSVTFSIRVIINSSTMFSLPNIIVMVFCMLILGEKTDLQVAGSNPRSATFSN